MTMRMRLFQSLRFALECFGFALVLAGIWRWAGLPREIWAVWIVAVLSMLGTFALIWLGDRVARRELMELIEAVCADAEAVPENVGSCTGASGMPRATGASTTVPTRDVEDAVPYCGGSEVPAGDCHVGADAPPRNDMDDGACENGRVMCEYDGYVLERSVEDENTVYTTMPDGLRLVFREDEYVGWYVCGERTD